MPGAQSKDPSARIGPPSAEELRAVFSRVGGFSVGIEEELMLVDPESLDLAPRCADVLEALGQDDRFRPELPAAQIEIVTPPAADVSGALAQLNAGRRALADATDGWLAIAGSGVHPFAPAVGVMSAGDRYSRIVDEYGWAAVRGMVFGLHIHVALGDADRTLAVYNALRSYLPQIAALAGNAPYFEGVDTGLASVRPKLAEMFPRQGIPPVIESWEAFAELLRWGYRTGSILDAKHLWWELRLNPVHGTLEIRAPDTQLRMSDTAGVVAFVQALVAWLAFRHDDGQALIVASDVRIAENRWRALRHGLSGTLADLQTGEPRLTRELIAETIETVRPAAEHLRSAAELELARELLASNGAERQRVVAAERGTRGLVEWMTKQFAQA